MQDLTDSAILFRLLLFFRLMIFFWSAELDIIETGYQLLTLGGTGNVKGMQIFPQNSTVIPSPIS